MLFYGQLCAGIFLGWDQLLPGVPTGNSSHKELRRKIGKSLYRLNKQDTLFFLCYFTTEPGQQGSPPFTVFMLSQRFSKLWVMPPQVGVELKNGKRNYSSVFLTNIVNIWSNSRGCYTQLMEAFKGILNPFAVCTQIWYTSIYISKNIIISMSLKQKSINLLRNHRKRTLLITRLRVIVKFSWGVIHW